MNATGDTHADALVPLASRLVGAVHDYDGDAIAELVDGADLSGLVVVLAGMTPDDRPARDLLAWMRHPAKFRRLRENGVDTLTATDLIASDERAGCMTPGSDPAAS